MLFFVDPQNGIPIFRQLMDQVKLHIASGLLKPGDELPSIRNLSIPLGVNPMTISKAYNLLVHDQVLIRRPGRPLIVAPIDGKEMVRRREDQLRSGLKPAVILAHQLGISVREALALFKTMLTDDNGSVAGRDD